VSGLELLVDGLDFGEGPRWHDGRLWYSDFYQHSVYAVSPGGARETILDLGSEQPSGLGWMPDGSLLVVAMTARRILRVADGVVTIHADLSEIATWHCNDMVVAADGTAYVGNFGWDIEHDRGHPLAATLAVVRPGGSVQSGPGDLLFPNGSVITPDGSTLIIAETFGGRFSAFPLDADGCPGEGREWAPVPGTAPDGCTLDSDGGIWFADAAGSGVVRVLEGGTITDRLPTPQPAYACMLGGDDGRTLFILTAPGAGADRAGTGEGCIWTTTVEYAGAGLP
jgi:sugar lactone lactonase YvrE